MGIKNAAICLCCFLQHILQAVLFCFSLTHSMSSSSDLRGRCSYISSVRLCFARGSALQCMYELSFSRHGERGHWCFWEQSSWFATLHWYKEPVWDLSIQILRLARIKCIIRFYCFLKQKIISMSTISEALPSCKNKSVFFFFCLSCS